MITQKYLQECFELINGELYWKHRPIWHFENEVGWKIWNKKYPGKLSGCITNNNYDHKFYIIAVNKKRYPRSNLIWLLIYGEYPNLEIIHIDNNTLNDNPINLKLATHSQATYHSKFRKNNTSKCKGIYWNERKSKWRSIITKNKKSIHLGYFSNKEDAIIARRNKAKELYGEFYKED